MKGGVVPLQKMDDAEASITTINPFFLFLSPYRIEPPKHCVCVDDDDDDG